MKKKRTKFRPGALWTTPSVILLLCLTILPLLMLLVFSFMNRNIFAGQPWPGWTLRNITRMFGSATFWRLMGKSLLTAGEVTLICIVAAYPAAWAIAKIVKPQHRSTLMMVVILPFFTSQLLLIYAMMNLIQTGGLLLTALDKHPKPYQIWYQVFCSRRSTPSAYTARKRGFIRTRPRYSY